MNAFFTLASCDFVSVDKVDVYPFAYGVEEADGAGSGDVGFGEDGFADLALLEQVGAHGSGQEAGFDGRREPFAVDIEDDVGERGLGDFATRVP